MRLTAIFGQNNYTTMDRYFIRESAAPFERILQELVQRGGKLLEVRNAYHPISDNEIWLVSDSDGYIRHSSEWAGFLYNLYHCGYIELRYNASDDSFYEHIRAGVWMRYRDRLPEKGRPVLRASRGPGFRNGTTYYVDRWTDWHELDRLLEMERQTGNEYWWQYIDELKDEEQ